MFAGANSEKGERTVQVGEGSSSRERAFVGSFSLRRQASAGETLLLALVATALAFLTSRGLRAMTGHIAPMWLSNAVLLAQMIVARPQRRYWVFAGGALGELIANLLVGRSLHAAFIFMSADILEVAVAFAFSPRVSTAAELIHPKSLVKFFLGGVLLAPVISGLFATVLLGEHLNNLLLPTLIPWFVSDGLSLVIITPVAVAFWTGEVGQLLRADGRLKTSLLLLLVCAVTTGVFGQTQFPILYWTLPPIVLLAFLADIPGVLVGLLLCLAIGLWFTIHRSGPFWLYPFSSMQGRIVALQLFFVAMLGMALPISLIQVQRTRLVTLLREGERRFRMLAENATDVVMSMSLDGRLSYVSPRALEVLGREPDDLIGIRYADLLPPDDADTLSVAIKNVTMGEPEASRISRFSCADGRVLWLETILRLVVDPLSGKPQGLTATVRDVTERRSLEEHLALERRELRELVFRDALTGLSNRRHFDQELMQLWNAARAGQGDVVVGLIMVDVDAFKSYNDHYGHQRGDDCLREIAQAIAAATRRCARNVARYGGEEFALILENIGPEEMLAVAESVREEVERLRIPHAASPMGVVSISVGAAVQRVGDDDEARSLIEASDRALYSAKRLGRNRTCVAPRAKANG